MFRPRFPGSHILLVALTLQTAAAVSAHTHQQPETGTDDLTTLMLGGRYRAAAAFVEAAARNRTDGCQIAVMRARLAIEQREWPAALAVSADACTNSDVEYLWYARGVAAARAVGRSERLASLPAAREAAERLTILAEARGRRSRAELFRVAVVASIVTSQDERDEMRLLLTHGVAIDAMLYDGQRVDARGAFHELAGDLWLQVDRYGDARAAYTAALEAEPRRARSMLGLARVASREEDRPGAERAYRRFLDLWNEADDDRPELAEAREYLNQTTAQPVGSVEHD